MQQREATQPLGNQNLPRQLPRRVQPQASGRMPSVTALPGAASEASVRHDHPRAIGQVDGDPGAVGPATWPGSMFMRGEPMKPATNRLAG